MSTVNPGADTDYILRTGLELWLNEYGPTLNGPQVLECGIEGRKGLLVTACRVAHDVAIGHGVVCEFAPQLQVDHRAVEPEAAGALDARVDIEYQVDPVAQRITDGRRHRVIDARVQLEDRLVQVDERGAHLQDAIQRIGEDAHGTQCQPGGGQRHPRGARS